MLNITKLKEIILAWDCQRINWSTKQWIYRRKQRHWT